MLTALAIVTPILFGPAIDANGNIKDMSDIEYRQDVRTGLCFSFYIKGNSWSHSIVPCTKEVLELVEKDRKRWTGE